MIHATTLLLGHLTGPQDPLKRALAQAALEQAHQDRWLPEMQLWLEQCLDIVALLVLIVLVAWTTRVLRKLVIVPLIRRTKNTWDDVFVDKAFFRWVSFLPPTLVAASAIEHLPGLNPLFENSELIVRSARQGLTALTTITGMLAVGALIDAGHEIYSRRTGPNQRPIKGYISLIKIRLM